MSAGRTKPACLLVLPWSLRFQGGVNEVVKSLIRHLEAEGEIRPIVMVGSTVQRHPEWDGRQSYTTLFEELASPYDPAAPVRGFFSFFAHLPSRLRRLWRLIREHRIAIVHAHYPSPGILHFAILRKLGLFRGGFLLSFHLGDAQIAEQTRGFERFLWRRLLRAADLILSPSNDLHNLILAVEPSAKPRLMTINNGVNFELFSRKPAELDRFPPEALGHPVIVSIGNFEERKGHHILLHAFVRVRERFPDAAVVMLGALFPFMEDLRRLIVELNLLGSAFLVENVPHEMVPVYLSRATLFALATRSETFPLAILEAGAAGVPVISTWAPGVPELITDKVNGRLIPVDDVEALARNIIELLENPAEASRLAGNLRAHVGANLTWAHHFQKHRSVYARWIGK